MFKIEIINWILCGAQIALLPFWALCWGKYPCCNRCSRAYTSIFLGPFSALLPFSGRPTLQQKSYSHSSHLLSRSHNFFSKFAMSTLYDLCSKYWGIPSFIFGFCLKEGTLPFFLLDFSILYLHFVHCVDLLPCITNCMGSSNYMLENTMHNAHKLCIYAGSQSSPRVPQYPHTEGSFLTRPEKGQETNI